MQPSRLARQPLQHYRNRDYVQHMLDQRHFDTLNEMDDSEACDLAMATTGCLDALDEVPAGAMEAWHGHWYDQQMASREFSAAEIAEREALADQLISEILAEEAA